MVLVLSEQPSPRTPLLVWSYKNDQTDAGCVVVMNLRLVVENFMKVEALVSTVLGSS